MFSQKMQHHEMVRAATGCPAGRACEELCSALSFNFSFCESLLYIFVCVCTLSPHAERPRGARLAACGAALGQVAAQCA